jgi:transaldolase
MHRFSMSDQTQLEQLKGLSTIVVDSGDFHLFEKIGAQDATTNPSVRGIY